MPKKVKIGENCPIFYHSKLKTDLARDIIFVSSASRICELKNLGLDFLNSLLRQSYVEKRTHRSILAHFSVQNEK